MESTIVKPDFVEKNTAKIELNTEDPGNVRVIANIPLGSGYLELLPGKDNQPAFVVVVARADQDCICLGVLEKAKHLVNIFNEQILMAREKLAQGVADFPSKLK